MTDTRGLRALSEEGVFKRFFLVTHDRVSLQRDGIVTIYWKDFLEKLWKDEIVPREERSGG